MASKWTKREKYHHIFQGHIGFSINIYTNLKEADFPDVTLNLKIGTYRPHKKPNDTVLYIHLL